MLSDELIGNMAKYERVTKSQAAQVAANPGSTAAASNSQENTSLNTSNNANAVNPNTNNSNPNTLSGNNTAQMKFDLEFNVWTKPDCDGQPVGANPNRTWFYFGVKGGHGKWIKFNLMNLNKQGRLFEMGMLPVFKTVPGHEKWARIYTRPSWQNNENNFLMSFVHKIPDKRETITYFAFCFPYSYEECQDMLEKYDKQFEYCKYVTPEKFDPDAIYYHRELLTYSCDYRRIDLITISGCNQLDFKREPRFDPDHLFPHPIDHGPREPRCLRFNKKRVFVLTSRVHPGETPASFVFNGFLDFILRKDDPRAKALRKHFVFKLIPMLNPDGVFRGHYRTDQYGVNLNRVYLDPCYRYHPSIYAAKSLIVYHHINNRTSKEHDGLDFENIFKLEYDRDEDMDTNEVLANENLMPLSDNSAKLTAPLSDEPTQNIKKTKDTSKSLDVTSTNLNGPGSGHKRTKIVASRSYNQSNQSNRDGSVCSSNSSSSKSDQLRANNSGLNTSNPYRKSNFKNIIDNISSEKNELSGSRTEKNHYLSTNALKLVSSAQLADLNHDSEQEKRADRSPSLQRANASRSRNALSNSNLNEGEALRVSSAQLHKVPISAISPRFSQKNSSPDKTDQEEKYRSESSPYRQSQKFQKILKSVSSHLEETRYEVPADSATFKPLVNSIQDPYIGNENSDEEDGNIFIGEKNNSPHLNDPKLALINPLWSGVAFYMDLHGHAAKKGCFIYGNSIENELYQVENVLFAKLISFNSQHFDFEGCNFSVKNMYMKDKREGLSKEGSGRVAMYKILGLIHSYTLECCYASGRVMNSIAPATNTASYNNRPNASSNGSISPPLHTDLPPKFLPEHYADVGKGVAIAALDLIEMNNYTRIPNTSFGSLEAVRNWVKFYIKSSKNGGGLSMTNGAANPLNPAEARLANAINGRNSPSSAGNQTSSNANGTANNNLNTRRSNNRFLLQQQQKVTKFIGSSSTAKTSTSSSSKVVISELPKQGETLKSKNSIGSPNVNNANTAANGAKQLTTQQIYNRRESNGGQPFKRPGYANQNGSRYNQASSNKPGQFLNDEKASSPGQQEPGTELGLNRNNSTNLGNSYKSSPSPSNLNRFQSLQPTNKSIIRNQIIKGKGDVERSLPNDGEIDANKNSVDANNNKQVFASKINYKINMRQLFPITKANVMSNPNPRSNTNLSLKQSPSVKTSSSVNGQISQNPMQSARNVLINMTIDNKALANDFVYNSNRKQVNNMNNGLFKQQPINRVGSNSSNGQPYAKNSKSLSEPFILGGENEFENNKITNSLNSCSLNVNNGSLVDSNFAELSPENTTKAKLAKNFSLFQNPSPYTAANPSQHGSSSQAKQQFQLMQPVTSILFSKTNAHSGALTTKNSKFFK